MSWHLIKFASAYRQRLSMRDTHTHGQKQTRYSGQAVRRRCIVESQTSCAAYQAFTVLWLLDYSKSRTSAAAATAAEGHTHIHTHTFA